MSTQYDDYLTKHIDAVGKAHQWLLDNGIAKHNVAENGIFWHDQSKKTKEEYDAYDKYFYGGNRSSQVVTDFNYAWLHHIHSNPHHWQYWVLFEDDPTTGDPYICLEMPENYALEMICDWWSFSFVKGDLREVFDWHEKHKNAIKLHKNTQKYVEDTLESIKKRLDELEAGESETKN